MHYFGELLSLVVALTWTGTALFAEVGSKRLGSLTLNVIRMGLSLLFLGGTLWWFTGTPLPMYADETTWGWLLLSGFVGYVLGDYCLFNAYVLIGSRFGQLFMTLAPIAAAIAGWLALGEHLSGSALLGMIITLSGIGLSVLNRGDNRKIGFKLPMKGVLLGIGAGVGQGLGLVLSKIGMNHYREGIPAGMDAVSDMLPFASTLIRAIIGTVGFLIMMAYSRQFNLLRTVHKDRKGMSAALGATILGPFLGVSMSLMAVQYTHAGIASTLMALTPIFILIPSHYLLKQSVTLREIIGAVISVIGVAFFFL